MDGDQRRSQPLTDNSVAPAGAEGAKGTPAVKTTEPHTPRRPNMRRANKTSAAGDEDEARRTLPHRTRPEEAGAGEDPRTIPHKHPHTAAAVDNEAVVVHSTKIPKNYSGRAFHNGRKRYATAS